MNEERIAAELAARVAEPVIAPVEQPETPDEPQNFVDKLLPEEQMTRGRLLDYFGVSVAERNDPHVADYVNTVYDWARTQAESGDFEQLLRVIMAQEQHMGATLRGDKLRVLGEYVKIAQLRTKLAIRERALYG